MATVREFAQDCRETSRNMRRLPAELRRALAAESKDRIASPLARDIAAGWSGPWNRVLRAGTKARAGADPVIVVGGSYPRLSGGAGPRQVVFGAEFGGGSRRTVIARTARRKGHARHTTRQFARHQQATVFPTIARRIGWVLEEFADIVDDVLKEVRGG